VYKVLFKNLKGRGFEKTWDNGEMDGFGSVLPYVMHINTNLLCQHLYKVGS